MANEDTSLRCILMGAFGRGQWREPYVGGDEGRIRIMVSSEAQFSFQWMKEEHGHFINKLVHVATRTFSLLHAMLL